MTSDLRNSGSRASASVSYKLSALVVRGTATIASTSQEIFIYDSLPTTPPICIGDFYPEYVCEQIASLRKRVFTKQGKLSISIDEPAPFELQHDRDVVQTKLPLSLLVRLRHGSQDEMPNFELISDITWRLKASTFVMMKENAALPTTKQASASPFVATCAVFETSQRMKVRWSQWQETSSRTDPNQRALNMRQDLLLSIPARCLPPPTFCTSYLVRRYSISLCMRIEGAGRANARFNVPVQIAYRSRAEEQTPDLSNSPIGHYSDELPCYVA